MSRKDSTEERTSVAERLVSILLKIFARFPALAAALTLFTMTEVAVRFSGIAQGIAALWENAVTLFWRNALFFVPPITKEFAVMITIVLSSAPLLISMSKTKKDTHGVFSITDRLFYFFFFIPLYMGVDFYFDAVSIDQFSTYEWIIYAALMVFLGLALTQVTFRMLLDGNGDVKFGDIFKNISEMIENGKTKRYIVLCGQIIFALVFLNIFGYLIDLLDVTGHLARLVEAIKAVQ